ncbi:hypothetical protein [Sphingomonas sp. SRS2]|uniref:hypothetical protein n=1 Tax=Sphingomonas sp. SRS2 TaxID=133190 RepID=UPI0006184794|nr:hypothetical protein [Sphingomonas sp. SRS2]KKC25485.1 hypothetical protein WP12_13485 [Sphingomonas sp. SRS2]
MTEHDSRYYHDRLIEERERALRAVTPEASAVHRALAQLYKQRLDGEIVDAGPSAFRRAGE